LRRHYQTGELIPEGLVQKIKDSSNFMEGMQTIRQIGFGLLDMAYHGASPDLTKPIQQFEQEILGRLSLLDPVPGTCMSTAFSHIFQGGYSAGYYSYKWAEVLDADAFEYFKEEGIFNKDVARAYRKHILAAGGVEHPSVLYRRFRGREANPEALMRRSGLLKKAG
jgi:peptidyl-dipeptidase Dcp